MLGARDEAAEFDEIDSGTSAEMFNDDPRLVVKWNNLIYIYTKHRIALKTRSDWLLKFQLSFAIHLRPI